MHCINQLFVIDGFLLWNGFRFIEIQDQHLRGISVNSISQADIPHLTLVSSLKETPRHTSEIDPVRFLQTISASLELDQVLDSLAGFLDQLVSQTGWEYRYAEFGLEFSGGQPDRHRLEYALTLNGHELGALKLMRGRRFSEADQIRIESLLGLAAQTLQHALRFFELNQQLERDPLTGLGNRRALKIQGAQWLADSQRHQEPLSMLVLDLDRFKSINDRFGHPLGDQLLCRIAETLRMQTRSADLCIRLGGDEFAVLLPRADLSEAMECAERIRHAVAQIALPTASDMTINPSVSIGVATCRVGAAAEHSHHLTDDRRTPDLSEAIECAERMRCAVAKLSDSLLVGAAIQSHECVDVPASRPETDLDLLYHQADDALYAAKRAGSNRVLAGASGMTG